MEILIPREPIVEHAILLSHSQFVKLEWCPFTGVYFLVHTGTQKAAELPPDYCGQWMLQFTKNGWGYVVDERGRIEKVHNFLQEDMYETHDGRLARGIDHDDLSSMSLEIFSETWPTHRQAKCRLYHGPLKGQVEIHVASFLHNYRGSVCMWSLRDLHAAVCGGQSNKLSWRWVNKYLPQWEVYAHRMGLPGQVIRSRRYRS